MTQKAEKFDERLAEAPAWVKLLGAYLLLLLVALADFLTGSELSFSIFYLAPIYLAAWHVGLRPATAMSLTAAGAWLLADIGTGHRYSHFLIPAWNALVRLSFFLITAVLLTRLRASMASLRDLADTDSLTGLHVSRAFYDQLSREIDRAGRYRHPFTIAYLDLDNFKEVNDSQGHEAGDRLLRLVAETLRSNARSSDVVARMGGDEFALLLPETGPQEGREVLKKIRRHLGVSIREGGWPVTASIGAVTYTRAGGSAQEILRQVDYLMYEVKKGGKDDIRHEVWPASGS